MSSPLVTGGAGFNGTDDDRMRLIYRIHSEALIRTLLYWTDGDRRLAEDLMQETMLRTWQNLEVLHRDPLSLRPWLMTVARRIAIDMLRARAARPAEVADAWYEELCEAVEPFAAVHDRSAIRVAVRRLSRDHLEVLVHVYILDHTIEQTACLLGVPAGTVKSRLHYALRAARPLAARLDA
jgi:RNA polymerase sigma-70 factor (ECF subfamily)